MHEAAGCVYFVTDPYTTALMQGRHQRREGLEDGDYKVH